MAIYIPDDSVQQFPILPLHAYFVSPAGAKSPDRPILPFGRQRGEKMNFPIMALQERLGHSGGKSEAGIGLIFSGVVEVGCETMRDKFPDGPGF